MIYAEIDENGKCFAVSDFGNNTLDKPTLIALDNYNIDVLGKIWTGTEWIEDITPVEEIIPTPPITNEEIYENQLIIMSALADIAEMQMEV